MSYPSLEAASHVPPRDYNFKLSGAWKCSHCGEAIWHSREDYDKERARVADLAARAADEDSDAQKEHSALL
eukprot:941606-Pleurochrysis_carterae.AAC.1